MGKFTCPVFPPSFLDDVGSAGEHAQEFLELLKALIKDSSGKWKSYLAMRGVLPQIGALITREIEHLQHLEETTLNSDLSQGCALKMLTGRFVLRSLCVGGDYPSLPSPVVISAIFSLQIFFSLSCRLNASSSSSRENW